MNRDFGKIKKIVVKLGTSVITDKSKNLDKAQIKNIVDQVCRLMKRNIRVIIVSSGAIGAGMGLLKLNKRPKLIPQAQASAAIGQSELMKVYDQFFRPEGILSAQVLLTREDVVDRKRYLNAKNAISQILDYNAVPIINENDTVSVDEIKFGDNDRLSSLVTNLVEADLLIMLTDTDGLYVKKEGKHKVLSVVDKITAEIEKEARGTTKQVSVGGMATKIEAARVVTGSGVACIIANGRQKDVLLKIIDGQDIGTLFVPKTAKLQARKRWLAFTSRLSGRIFVDQGAKDALIAKGKSLLPSGITKCEGKFEAGDAVSVIDSSNHELARGLVNYSSEQINQIKGKKTSEIGAILGHKDYDEVIHRDNLVVL